MMSGFQIVGGYDRQESFPYFIIGEIQQVAVTAFVITFDGEVAALVNHRQRLFHIGFVIGKERSIIVFPCKFINLFVAMLQQPHQIGRRARSKPVVTDL